MKKEMALIKVIDLTKREEQEKELENQLKNDIVGEGREKINYEILKAKDQVNEAFKTLFAKDSKLHQIKPLTREVNLPNFEQGQFEKLKIGTIRVNGHQIKSVVNLVPNDVKELKSHLSIFSA